MKKNILFYFINMCLLFSYNSCSKIKTQDISTSRIYLSQKTASIEVTNQVLAPTCDYVPLTQNSNGEWTCYYHGIEIKFNQLQVRQDNKLYGALLTNGTNYIVQDYAGVQRIFSLEVPICTASAADHISKEYVDSAYFSNLGQGNSTFILHNSQIYTSSTMFPGVNEDYLSGDKDVFGYLITAHHFTPTFSCASTKTLVGKFVRKQLLGGSYECGIADICYPEAVGDTTGI